MQDLVLGKELAPLLLEPGRQVAAAVAEDAAAVVPVEALVGSGAAAPNAVLASFAGKVPSGEERPALVVVATQDIASGEAVVVSDPWA